MQRNWIGKSEGVDIDFEIKGADAAFTVFTTRPDTLFGATYCVFAPEHPLVEQITTDERMAAVRAYVEEARSKTDLQRTDLAKEKTGVFTGAYAINPANDKAIPIWVADYVLMGYGTGAIMAVPAEDHRDQAFAETFNLPIVCTQPPIDFWDEIYRSIKDPKKRMTRWLTDEEKGKVQVQYRLRDWLSLASTLLGRALPHCAVGRWHDYAPT